MNILIWGAAYQHWPEVHPRCLVDPDSPQIGGSEASMLMAAQTLAGMGANVSVVCKIRHPETIAGVHYVPLGFGQAALFSAAWDAIVSWDDPYVFRFNVGDIPKRIVAHQLNDARYTGFELVITGTFHPSKWHADRFHRLYAFPQEKQHVRMTNGADPLIYSLDAPKQRERRVVWATSPDRGLHHLLRIWPKVLDEVPDARLSIFYDMQRWLSAVAEMSRRGVQLSTTERAQEIQRLLPPLLETGTVDLFGATSRPRVLMHLLGSSVFAYPCDPVAPTEGFSMATLEAWLCGCHTLISDADAFPELWGGREGITMLPLPVDDAVWVDQIVKGLESPPPSGRRDCPDDLRWSTIGRKWMEVLNESG